VQQVPSKILDQITQRHFLNELILQEILLSKRVSDDLLNWYPTRITSVKIDTLYCTWNKKADIFLQQKINFWWKIWQFFEQIGAEVIPLNSWLRPRGKKE
jgi:hypothetical protein